MTTAARQHKKRGGAGPPLILSLRSPLPARSRRRPLPSSRSRRTRTAIRSTSAAGCSGRCFPCCSGSTSGREAGSF
jgi:hypothetical protein